jgi:CAAX protease family protein
MSESLARTPNSLWWPYFLPYFAYVAIGALADPRVHAEAVYGARLVVVGALLLWFRGEYLPLRGPRPLAGSLALGAATGLAGTALWWWLRAPFGAPSAEPWSDSAWLARALGSSTLPPFAEELLFRGFALRALVLVERAGRVGDVLDRASLADVGPGEWSALAVAASSALFAIGHWPAEWLAAFAYGLLMCALWIARGDLVSCISAHAVTNAALALWVRASGHWGSW